MGVVTPATRWTPIAQSVVVQSRQKGSVTALHVERVSHDDFGLLMHDAQCLIDESNYVNVLPKLSRGLLQ